MNTYDFIEWLINEARLGYAPGSKSDPRMRNRFATNPDKQSGGLGIMGMNYQDRVARGRGVEEKIKEALYRQHKIQITPASQSADMYDKIDGFWNNEPIQIKYRDRGSAGDRVDILYELIRPYNPNIPMDQQNPGRDVLSKAAYYVVLDPTGRMIYKVPTKMIKLLMRQTLRELGDRPLLKSFKGSNGVELRLTSDPSSGVQKIIGFLNPAIFTGIAEKYPVSIQI